jgi:hypothetical protein
MPSDLPPITVSFVSKNDFTCSSGALLRKVSWSSRSDWDPVLSSLRMFFWSGFFASPKDPNLAATLTTPVSTVATSAVWLPLYGVLRNMIPFRRRLSSGAKSGASMMALHICLSAQCPQEQMDQRYLLGNDASEAVADEHNRALVILNHRKHDFRLPIFNRVLDLLQCGSQSAQAIFVRCSAKCRGAFRQRHPQGIRMSKHAIPVGRQVEGRAARACHLHVPTCPIGRRLCHGVR